MAKDHIGYQALADAAMRGIVREALRSVEKKGLIGNHHFFISFKTNYPDIDLPDFLKEQYPEEMTIVLQHEFWGLEVKDDAFEVVLKFRKVPATLHIPFQAITAFVDKGANFGLQFQPLGDGQAQPQSGSAKAAVIRSTPIEAAEETAKKASPFQTPLEQKETSSEAPSSDKATEEKPNAGEVVSLDQFRKK